MMMKYRHKLLSILTAFLFCPPALQAAPLLAPECRSIQITEGEYKGPSKFDRGLLWRIDKDGREPSYIFGTIHVADEAIVNLPEEVEKKLEHSKHFVMEALPEPGEQMLLSAMMFFNDGKKLTDVVPRAIYDKAVEILSAYHLSEDVIEMMKPWAVFVSMSYPPDLREILDLRLMETAQENGAELGGLETLQEQGNIFDKLDLKDQVALLTDSVCHHDLMINDFEVMKTFYLKRDLKGLYKYGQRYSFNDNSMYEALTKRILFERNKTMVKRMEPVLKKGNAFIAIGAMHLPGDGGVLDLLNKENYKLSRIY